ncbi:Sec-independent protein translocase subunit TatA [Kitasatospora sp. NBC_00240]|uniref:Sec-independent protein translocase subunit TatA n=1 Tax=Kitasatospora sp. NBC_00240 TaxID=2903567 RepID=UPI00225B777C|nr:Sec-independent protein translocase subunit TatA [Kitasatospora sp. NBC_00240]MCX5208913.1 Sec-independent protein translocase subunit TatA [Kitasatospora sp. NBC_00240]
MLRNGLEPWHLLVVLAVIILLFGSKKLPEMARGLGKSMRILKAETKALREDDVPAEGSVAEDAPAPPAGRPRPAPVTASNITALRENSRSADAP